MAPLCQCASDHQGICPKAVCRTKSNVLLLLSEGQVSVTQQFAQASWEKWLSHLFLCPVGKAVAPHTVCAPSHCWVPISLNQLANHLFIYFPKFTTREIAHLFAQCHCNLKGQHWVTPDSAPEHFVLLQLCLAKVLVNLSIVCRAHILYRWYGCNQLTGTPQINLYCASASECQGLVNNSNITLCQLCAGKKSKNSGSSSPVCEEP